MRASQQVYKEYVAAGLWIEVEKPKFHKVGQDIAIIDAKLKGKNEYARLQVIILKPFKL